MSLAKISLAGRRLGSWPINDSTLPIYSDLDDIHDFVVQARGAFAQTVRGLHNLARWGVRIELRIVLHRLTADRLPQIAEYIYRNLTFAEHVALADQPELA